MRIFTDGRKYPKEWLMSFTNMDKYAYLAPGDFVFIEVRANFRVLKQLPPGTKIVYFEMEEPNRFFVKDPVFRRDEYENCFYKLLVLCPYTAEWLNKKQGAIRRIPAFYPVDGELAPPVMEKKYDIIYSGGIYSDWIFDDVKAMAKFNHKFIAHNGVLTYKLIPNSYPVRKVRYYFPKLHFWESGWRYVTESNIPHLEKWKIMAQTKISLCHNLLQCDIPSLKNVYATEGWEDNEAFSQLPRPKERNAFKNFFDHLRGKNWLVPQLKTRIFEAALCRSLILCRRDPWNLVERFFEPDKEFVYYEPGKLEEKVQEILANYDSYKPMIERAHKKFMAEYTTKRFVEKFLKDMK